MREPDSAAGVVVSVEDDAPPFVRAVAADLLEALTDPGFATATRAVSGTASIRSAVTPEAAAVIVDDGRIEIAAGPGAERPGVTATIDQPGSPGAAIEGDGDLAEWTARLLDPPLPSWESAAERFWEVLSSRPGGPDGLLVVELDEGGQRRFGREGGRTCELHGAAPGLVRMLTGRASAIEAAFEGEIHLRGTFPDLSTLSGAGYAIRYGHGMPDG